MAKKSTNKNELDACIEKLLTLGSEGGSVTEDDIQVVLKDVEVTDAQLNAVYQFLRDKGVEITSQGVDGEDSPLDEDDVSSLGDDDEIEDQDAKIAKVAEREMGAAKTKRSGAVRTTMLVQSDMGDVDLSGALVGEIEVNANLGTVRIDSQLPRSAYALDLASNLGSLTVDGERIGTDSIGPSLQQEDGENSLHVRADMGDILVQFAAEE